MLTRLALINYQSHRNTVLELGPFTVIVGPSSSGKAQPLDSLVLTPTGYRRMGDLAVGDPVIDPEGQPSEVIGITPQGVQPIYRVTFSDGSSCECTADHLWSIERNTYAPGAHSVRKHVWKREVVPLSSISQASMSHSPRPRLAHRTLAEIDLEESVLPLDPYVLGLLLGDGYLCSQTPNFVSADFEIIDALRTGLPEGVFLSEAVRHNGADQYRLICGKRGNRRQNILVSILTELGLCGHRSWEKFVPDQYKVASYKTRLSILQGLMDTDGWCEKGEAAFVSTSERLRDDVVWLARSLGFVVTYRQREMSYWNKQHSEVRAARTAYFAHIKGGQVSPFRLERKASIARKLYRGSAHPPRTFRAIKYVRDAECQCISVSAESRNYITDDFIPTHNSAVVRSLRLLVSNARGTSYVRHGARTARIEGAFAQFEGDPLDAQIQVAVERGPSSSVYELRIPGEDLLTFTKCGTSVPDIVQAAHDLGNDELWVADQFDRPFLLTETGSQIARVLGDLTNVSMIFTAVKECNRRASESKRRLTDRLIELDLAREQLRVYLDLPAKLAACSAAEAAVARAGVLEQRRIRLSDLVVSAENASMRAADARARIRPVPSIEWLLTSESRRSRLAELVRMVVDAEDRRAAIRITTVPDISHLTILSQRRIRLRTLLLEVGQAEVSRRKSVEQAGLAQTAAEEARDRLDEALAAAGMCPMCGASAEHAHVDRVLSGRS